MKFTLQDLGLLDAPPEPDFDNLTQLACDLMQVPVAHISVLDRDKKRIFFKSQQGHTGDLLRSRELPMGQTYCQQVPLKSAPLIVNDARLHPALKGTPAQTPDQPRAYIGMPVYMPAGQVIGGLCVMRPDPHEWSEAEIARASKLAGCVSDLIHLRVAIRTSEQSRREQRDFVYAISHDLKSPANTLRMIIDEIILEKDRLSPDLQGFLGNGLAALSRMDTQIEDVLTYAHTIGPKQGFTTVDLSQLLAEVIAHRQGMIDETGATITAEALPTVKGDAIQLRAMLDNLISNSLKFTRPDVPPRITITVRHDPEWRGHRISIADNGIGIPKQDQTKVFDMFTRLHLPDIYPGTGIGLALCRRAAENHNGTIAVASDGTNGTTFTVTLAEAA
ncbi:GAF domain-containing sensor histidine kinase [Alphaproteobacteria bacterium KMM 3653]|uniref:histidine kinase n=1 Tax=Harenicola maris TaxID=2841044 RepID=A0AAP2CQ68_9RHOB|nr:GAF domain-containing sensor histidine kinase [Harenicola maris]